MTLTAVPFALQNGSHGAQLFREAVSSLISPAGGVIGLDDLFVSQNGTPNMSVNVDPGRCWVPGTSLATITPQTGNTYYPQGLYYAENDAAVNVPISASSPSLPRIDQIIVQIQDSAYTGSTNSASLVPLTGTPTSGAALNNLVGLASIPVSSMLVVPANATSIVTADIAYVAQQCAAGLPAPWKWAATGGAATAWPGQFISATGGNYTITLPPVSANTTVGVVSGGGVTTVAAQGSAKIYGLGLSGSGQTSFTLGMFGAYAILISDGTNWTIIGGQQDTGWVALSLTTNVTALASAYTPSYRQQADRVHLKGGVNMAGGFAGGALATNLPHPAATVFPNSPNPLTVTTGGALSTTASGLGTYGLDGMSYSLS